MFDLWPFQNGMSLPHYRSEKPASRKDFFKYIFPSHKKTTKQKVQHNAIGGAMSEGHSEENCQTNENNPPASRIVQQSTNNKRKRTNPSFENCTPYKRQKTRPEPVLGSNNSAQNRAEGKGDFLANVSLPFPGQEFTDVQVELQVKQPERLQR